jgi:hypothetical protein
MNDTETESAINKSRRNLLVNTAAVTAAIAASSVSAAKESYHHPW